MNDKRFENKIKKAIMHSQKVKQNQELYELRHSNDKPKEKLSFSKRAFIFLVGNCTVIEIYALITMVYFQDLSSLSALIVAVVGDCVTMLAYMVKSQHENTSGGIVFETAMKKLEHELSNESNGDDSVG